MTRTPVFSVIIPTAGRTSLRRTLNRLSSESEGDIEGIVVTDGEQPLARAITDDVSTRWHDVRFIEGPETRRWGNAQRMAGIAEATGQYLMFMDDDDIHSRGAFRHVRKAVENHPDRIIIFRMKRRAETFWQKPLLIEANVGTPMFLVPNRPDSVGSWLSADRYQSDFDFISECVELQGEPVWDPSVIALTDLFRWATRRQWFDYRFNLMRRRIMLRTRIRTSAVRARRLTSRGQRLLP